MELTSVCISINLATEPFAVIYYLHQEVLETGFSKMLTRDTLIGVEDLAGYQ